MRILIRRDPNSFELLNSDVLGVKTALEFEEKVDENIIKRSFSHFRIFFSREETNFKCEIHFFKEYFRGLSPLT